MSGRRPDDLMASVVFRETGGMNESIKVRIRKRYGEIALDGNSDCCSQDDCVTGGSQVDVSKMTVCDAYDLRSIQDGAILGVGCGAPIKFADLAVPDEVLYLEGEKAGGRRITSLVILTIK